MPKKTSKAIKQEPLAQNTDMEPPSSSEEEEVPSPSKPAGSSKPSKKTLHSRGPMHNIPTFSGDGLADVHDWSEQFEWIARMNKWDEDLGRRYFGAALRGPAGRWVRTVENFEDKKVPELRQLLEVQFGDTAAARRQSLAGQARARKQGEEETVATFAADHHDLCARAKLSEDDALAHFCQGLRKSLRRHVVPREPQTLAEAVRIAKAAERAERLDSDSDPAPRKPARRAPKPKVAAARTCRKTKRAPVPEEQEEESPSSRDKAPAPAPALPALASLEHTIAALTQQLRSTRFPQQRAPKDLICFTCGETGHMSHACPKLPEEERARRKAAFERGRKLREEQRARAAAGQQGNGTAAK